MMPELKKMFRDDPSHPSLGLLLRMLRFCGLWHTELKSLKARLKLLCFITTLAFFCSQYVKFALNFKQKSMNELLQHTPFHLGLLKWLFFFKDYKYWKKLVRIISSVELKQSVENDEEQLKLIKNYLSRSRRVTYFFLAMACVANITIYIEPYLRNQEESGEVYNYIFETYSPFKRQPPWYYFTMVFQTMFGLIMSYYVACWDMTTVTMMIYLAGQLRISGLNCSRVIDINSRENSVRNIAECHRFHRMIVMSLTMFNSLISPVMFLYVVIISVNLGACIIQIAALESNLSTLIATSVYTTALLIELLLFYWHSNEVTVESERVSYNTFKSNWVDVNSRLQRQVLLLSFTTSKRLVFKAGPFNEMTLSTFISILRGTYSFYALLKETS